VRHLDDAKGRTPIEGHSASGQRDGAVAKIGDHHLVAGTERHGTKHRVEAGRDVGDEDEILGT
jgi:hypothetical protein